MNLRKKQDDPEIPTASMADIAFLLIVFFMLTTVFAETRGINFSVPPQDQEDQEEPTEREEAVHIKIDGGGGITIDGIAVPAGRVFRDFKGHLIPKLENWPEKPILVTADKTAPYGAFVEVYDALRQVEKVAWENGIPVPRTGLKVSIPSLAEIERLKAVFGEDIFG